MKAAMGRRKARPRTLTGRGRPIARQRMWPDAAVRVPPWTDHDLHRRDPLATRSSGSAFSSQADVLGDAVQAHRPRRRFDHAEAVDAPGHLRGEAHPAMLLDPCQDAQIPAVVGPGLRSRSSGHGCEGADAIVGPSGRSTRNDCAVPVGRGLQPLATPDALMVSLSNHGPGSLPTCQPPAVVR